MTSNRNARHTKGPWILATSDGVPTLHTIWDNDDSRILIARTCFAPASEANARLIAAAPDLLTACRTALISLRAWNSMTVRPGIERKIVEDTYEHSPEIKALVAAIQKAEATA